MLPIGTPCRPRSRSDTTAPTETAATPAMLSKTSNTNWQGRLRTQRSIDSDRCSDIAVRAADEWLLDADEREDLKRSNDDLVAIARDEDVILVDVDAWREAATARLLPPDGEPAADQRDRVEAYGVKGMKSTPWRRTFPHFGALQKWADKNNAEIHGTRIPD